MKTNISSFLKNTGKLVSMIIFLFHRFFKGVNIYLVTLICIPSCHNKMVGTEAYRSELNFLLLRREGQFLWNVLPEACIIVLVWFYKKKKKNYEVIKKDRLTAWINKWKLLHIFYTYIYKRQIKRNIEDICACVRIHFKLFAQYLVSRLVIFSAPTFLEGSASWSMTQNSKQMPIVQLWWMEYEIICSNTGRKIWKTLYYNTYCNNIDYRNDPGSIPGWGSYIFYK